VVRHALVQRIVRAYDAIKPQQQELPLGTGEAIDVNAQARENRQQAQQQSVPKPQ
jgi:hypothetical protein